MKFKVTDRIEGKTEIIFQSNEFYDVLEYVKVLNRDDTKFIKGLRKRIGVCGEIRIKNKSIIIYLDKRFNSSKTKALRLEHFKKNFKHMYLVKLFKTNGNVRYEFYDTINTFSKFKRMFGNNYPDLCKLIIKVNDSRSYYIDSYKKSHHLKHGVWYILLRGDQTNYEGNDVKGLVRYTNLKELLVKI